MFPLGCVITVASSSHKSETEVTGFFYYDGCYVLGAAAHPVPSLLIYLGLHRDAGQLSSERGSLLPSDPERLSLEMTQCLPYHIPPALPLTWMPAWNWPFPLDLMASFGCLIPRRDRHHFCVTPDCPFTVTSCLIFSGPSASPTLFAWPPGSSFPTKWVVEERGSSCAGAPLLSTILSLLCCFSSGLWLLTVLGTSFPCLFIRV